MNNLKKYIFASCIGAFALTSLTGCMEETEPTDVATTDQIQASAASSEGLVWAMPAKFNFVWDEDYHFSFGYGAMMQIRDQLTQDCCLIGDLGYTWWDKWAQNKYQGEGYLYGQYIWNYNYGFILAANNLLGSINYETANDDQKGMYACGLAYRAFVYLDMARMYEYLPTDGTSNVNADGNDVKNLTVPIVKETTSQDEARKNPRATREVMAKFIEEDLTKAEADIEKLPATLATSKTLPDLACVYGLKARLYMWIEDYAKAKDYARKAIDASHQNPMTKEEALDATTGFNDINKWMWGADQTKESETVKSGIINFTSWMSNQTEFGYTGMGTGMFVGIDKSVYDRISNTDWRKLEFKAPKNSVLYGKNVFLPSFNEDYKNAVVELSSLKFRPNSGNMGDANTGAAAAFPIMRVEEMYLIEAEAAAHLNVEEGIKLINNFMKTRDPKYSCKVTEAEDVIEEIVFQKRVELWGEGHTFFDIKRLDYPVVRGYVGTNHAELERLNTTRRPAWMNLVMVQTEQNNNEGVVGFNNPDPSDCYEPWEEEE